MHILMEYLYGKKKTRFLSLFITALDLSSER